MAPVRIKKGARNAHKNALFPTPHSGVTRPYIYIFCFLSEPPFTPKLILKSCDFPLNRRSSKPHVSATSGATWLTSVRLHSRMSMQVAPEIAKNSAGTFFFFKSMRHREVGRFEQLHCRQWGATNRSGVNGRLKLEFVFLRTPPLKL